jgi:uncharacterized protein (DUF1800 family)
LVTRANNFFPQFGLIIREELRLSPLGVLMQLGRKKFAASLVFFTLACGAPQLLAKKKDEANSGPNEQRRALQALNRLTFGPRPGDVQQVMAMGVDRWIDLQLHPEKIDDSALNSQLEPFRTIRMSTKEIAENFPDPQEINQVMNGKKAMPSDPAQRAIYEVQLARREARKEQKEEAEKIAADPVTTPKTADGSERSTAAAAGRSTAMDPAMNGVVSDAANSAAGNTGTAVPESSVKPGPEEEEQARLREEKLYGDLDVQQLPSLPPDQRYKKILALPLDELVMVADSLRGGKGQDFLEGLAPQQKETLLALNYPPGVVDGELTEAKLLRAIYSQRQLEEVMTDFWLNHFNVFVGKGLDRIMLTSYERDVLRPHALGRFENLLVATAKSPAMLFYLDNWMSVGPNSPQALGLPLLPYGPHGGRTPTRPNRGKRPNGLNENYGRELLELHTLSVNGGYSQRDVTEVAKVFTGWTIDKPAQGGGFKFEPRMHEPGPKFVLGHRVKPKGENEGLELLHRLATSPQTAHFISLKLAERFVSDDPPPALVDRMAKTFLKKKGDIREVLTVLFHSPEFWDDATYRAKVKTPLEFVASTIRATGAEVDDAMSLTQQLNKMGMPLYGAQPPTGYSMKAETWVSSSALLNRMNFALALTSGKIRGVKVDAQVAGLSVASDPSASGRSAVDPSLVVSTLENNLVAGGVSQQTHDSIVAQIEATKNNSPSTLAGLLLGSPEFQRR